MHLLFSKAMLATALLASVPLVQANELEVYLNQQGSGLVDNLEYAVQDGIVAELLASNLTAQESQGRCLRLMHDLGQAPLGVAVRAVVIVSGLDADQQAVYSCF
jgi:hypothetical protein